MTAIDHDRLFKTLLRHFFDEFLEAFFPDVYDALNLSQKKFLSEELFPDIIEGDKKRADIIAETHLKKSAGDVVLIIYIEAQNYPQKNFAQRMYIYFSMIYLKFRKPVLPIAIFSYDKGKEASNRWTLSTPFLDVNTFRFLKLELRTLNWRRFMHMNNPAATALMSKMHYTKQERVEVRKVFLRQLLHMDIDDAHRSLINGFFESYLHLNNEEEAKLMRELHPLSQEEKEEILSKWPNSFRDRFIKEGFEKGRKKGIEQGFEQGIEQGIEKGIFEGEKKEKQKIARQMILRQMDVKMIAELTGLTVQEIDALKKEDK